MCFDIACVHWRAEFAPFEADCRDAVCEFVREHFDSLMDRYYAEGYEELIDSPAWAFERHLQEEPP